MRLNYNQYSGLEEERPNKLTPGSIYTAIDTKNIYIYNIVGEGQLANAAHVETGVPYTGATQDLDLGANGLISQSLQVSGGTGAEGTLSWNSVEATMDLQSGGVTYQIGQEIAPLVKNSTGTLIANGTPVRFSGTLGASGRILVAPAIADGTIPSSYILGVATEDIANGADGHVTWFGKIRGIQTNGGNYGQVWADGDIVYVSETTAGYLTNVKPQAPNLQIFIGVVINAHGSNGTLFTRPSWRSTLEDLDDVNGTPSTVSGQMLVWDNDLSLFDFTDNINNYAKLGNSGAPFTLVAGPAGSSTYSDANGLVYLSWSGVAGQYNLTLPSAATIPYRVIRFISDGGINATDKIHLIPTGAETIDGAAEYILNKPYGGVQAWSDGTNWIIMQAKG